MNVQEIRIGNIFTTKFNRRPERVESIEPNAAVSGGYSVQLSRGMKSGINTLVPVKLTEDILSKCGFKRVDVVGTNTSFWTLIRKRGDYSKPSIDIYKNRTSVGNNTSVKHIEYLHQLQNIYFDLTGKELAINSDGENS